MANGVFRLNLDETFPRLSKPPIVEAAVHWQARPGRRLDPDTLPGALSERFAAFPTISPMHTIEASVGFSSGGDVTGAHQRGLLGFRLESETGREVVQVFRDGLTYSVVKDYSHWDSFSEAARDVWDRFVDLAAPSEIQRLGVRFINHFPTGTGETVADIFQETPACPAGLPLKEFVHQSSFAVPSLAYGVRVIQVLQGSDQGTLQSSGLFLDVDAYTTKSIENDEGEIDLALRHLRWLKNKVFFALLTQSAIDSFA